LFSSVLVSATENIDDTPAGQLLHGIMSTIAEFYSANLAAEAKKGLQQKAKLGGTPSLAPIGYLNVIERVEGSREVRTVAVDAERAPHVVWAFETFASGEWTIRQLTEALEARGLRTRATARLPSKPLSNTRVHKMLRHPYYTGVIVYGGVRYDGRHQALVSPELFMRVQDVLDGHRRAGERPQRRTHYLTGTLYCGLCKRMLSIGYSRGRHGGVYPYFFCLGRHRDKQCSLPYLSFGTVEAMVDDYWRQVRVEPEQLEATRADVRQHIARMTRRHEGERKRQQTRLERLDAESRKLMQALYNHAVPMDVLREEQARIARDRAEAEVVLQTLTTEQAQLDAALDEALSFVASAHVVYAGGTEQVRRDLNHALFNRLYIVPDGVAGADLASPYVELLTDDLAERLVNDERVVQGEPFVPSPPAREDGWDGPIARWLERPRGALPAENREPGSSA
jgi:hypothetical protein